MDRLDRIVRWSVAFVGQLRSLVKLSSDVTMATVEFEGVFDQMRLTSRLPDKITCEAYLNVNSHVATPAVLNDSQIVELSSTGDDSECEDADADNQNVEIPSSSKAMILLDQLRRFVECPRDSVSMFS
ncbi:hypothetical protein T11_12877 [Trichinella zimbabwensis]|uniref:Uncharacterized protein n=1 Tax=Trichinella zimbabwensis TaxID=268475 RepID=A0A0V1HGR1_9BILA|nr:hypothetical protein T11_12877 [Trichinella zimbabwensis]